MDWRRIQLQAGSETSGIGGWDHAFLWLVRLGLIRFALVLFVWLGFSAFRQARAESGGGDSLGGQKEEGNSLEKEEGLSPEEKQQRAEVVKAIERVEKIVQERNNEEAKSELEKLNYHFAEKDKPGEVAPALKWKRLNLSYKGRKFDSYYFDKKKDFVAAKEKYDADVFRVKKAQAAAYRKIHDNALRLIRKARAGAFPEKESEIIESWLKGDRVE